MRYKYTGIFDSKTNEMLLESRSYFKYRGYSDNTMNNYCSEINEGEYYVISAGNIFSLICTRISSKLKSDGNASFIIVL